MSKKCTKIISLALCFIMFIPISAFAQQSTDDYSNHWAGNQIKSFLDKGFITINNDGNFWPNDPITRGDFAAIANKAFNFTEKDSVKFKDVNPNENYYNDIMIAKKAGYLIGLPDGTVMPISYMSRQEYAIIISRLLKLDTTKYIDEANNFNDAADISDWSKGAIGAVAKAGYMHGEPGNVFNPKGFITRGQAVAVLERCYLANVKVAYNEPGTYSSNVIEGNVAINVPDVELENTTITGNLIIGEGVGDGTVKLRNVIVKGDTIVKGGGLNSIIIEDSQIKNIIIIKEDNKVRIVAVGTTTVEQVDMQSGGKLEEQGTTGTGFGYVTIAESVDPDEPIILMGNFDSVQIQGDGIKLDVASGSIAKLGVAPTATNTQINLGTGVAVTELIVEANTEVTGTGTIETAEVLAQETIIAVPTTTITPGEGITVETPPSTTTPEPTPTTPSSGGSSGGGGDKIYITDISVTGTGGATTITTVNGTLQMLAAIKPSNATNKTVTWSVTNGTGTATISSTGLLTAVSNGTVTVKATAKDGSGKYGEKEITITGQAVAPEAKGTIELAEEFNGGENAIVAVDGQTIIFDGELAFYQLGNMSGNYVGVKITAPEGVMPDENAVLTVHGQNCNLNGEPGWENIIEEGDGDNYFHVYQRVRNTAYVYEIEIKWNNDLTETYAILVKGTATLEVYKTDLENLINGAQYNYENAADYGNISEEAIDALGTAIDAAQQVYDDAVDAKTDAVQESIYEAQDKLITAMDAFFDAYETEIEIVSDNIAANTTYTDTDPLIVSLSLIDGIGDFVSDLENYITLNGALSQMVIKSVTLEGDPATKAILELTGTTGDSITGTISIAEGGVNGHSHGFEATLAAVKGTIELAADFNGGENAIVDVDGQTIIFDGELAFYQLGNMSGNYVGVKITAPEGVMPDENAVLTVHGQNCNLNGEPGWENITEEGDGDNYFHVYQRVRNTAYVYEIEIKWNNDVTETYEILVKGTATLEVYKADLEDMINGAQYNYENAADYGNISEEAIDALGTAIDAAQQVYDDAVDAKTDAVQESIYEAQDKLITAMDAFFDAYETEIEIVSDNIAANTTYTDTDPLIVSLSLIDGIGDFVTENTDYITLGGAISEMTIKSVTFEGDPATKAILELTGTTGDSITGTISIAEGGVNGHSHGFESALATAKGTIELAEDFNGGENAIVAVDGQTIIFDGELAFYHADESNGLPMSGNWVGVKITAPEGVIPDENAVLTVYGEEVGNGWDNIRKDGDGDNYFHLYHRIDKTAFVYEIEIKWNNDLTETYAILVKGTATLEVYKTDLENLINDAQNEYDNAEENGYTNVEIIDALGTTIANARQVYDEAVDAKSDAVQESIYIAQDELIAAMDAFFDSYETEIETVSDNLAANTTYDDTNPLIISLNIMGTGDFDSENTDYITLGGDLSEMTIKSVTFEGDPANRVILELTGDIGDSIENCTISIAEGGVNGHSHGFECICTLETEAKGTIEVVEEFNGGENAIVSIDGQDITFDGELAYYIADESNGLPISGNWIQVKITAPEGVMPDENAVLTVNGQNCNLDGNPGWDNIREEGDGDNYFHLGKRVRYTPQVCEIEIKWNNDLTETYYIDFPDTATLEVDRTDLGNLISDAKYEYDTAEEHGYTDVEAIHLLGDAVDAAQQVYDDAVDVKSDTVIESVYAAQNELTEAMYIFFDSYETEIEAVSDNIVANTAYTDTDPLIVSLDIMGTGDFVSDLQNYITLGGDLSKMTIKSVTFEGDPTNRVILELTGDIGDSIENCTISIAEGGVNGHSHGFEAIWAP